MSTIDIFAWIVLIVLTASTVFVIVFMAMLPGMIAKRRNHPWKEAVAVGARDRTFRNPDPALRRPDPA